MSQTPATRRQLRERDTPSSTSSSKTSTTTPSVVKMRTRLSTGTLIMNGTSTIKEKDVQTAHLTSGPDVPKPRRDTPSAGSKRHASPAEIVTAVLPKQRKVAASEGQEMKSGSDPYCWICHREGSTHFCLLCPRSYHLKCLSISSVPKDWVCGDCEKIMRAECKDTCSKAMKLIGTDTLCLLLRYALDRMRQPGSEVFQKPVNATDIPVYSDVICNPMDFLTLEKNIKKKEYGSTEAFLADVKWILHNCIIFNGLHHKLTHVARNVVKSCKHEMAEIEVCPQCYRHSCLGREANWFIEPCDPPHTLVWAKLKGYPFWPAKALQEENGHLDVRFFGAHDKSVLPLSQVFLLSKESPSTMKNRKGVYEQAIDEMEAHIKIIRARYGSFEYAPFRTPYDRGHVYMKNRLKDLNMMASTRFKVAAHGRQAIKGKEAEKVSAASKTVSALKSKYSIMASKKTGSAIRQGPALQLQTASSVQIKHSLSPETAEKAIRRALDDCGKTEVSKSPFINPTVSVMDIIRQKVQKQQEIEAVEVISDEEEEKKDNEMLKMNQEADEGPKEDDEDRQRSSCQEKKSQETESCTSNVSVSQRISTKDESSSNKSSAEKNIAEIERPERNIVITVADIHRDPSNVLEAGKVVEDSKTEDLPSAPSGSTTASDSQLESVQSPKSGEKYKDSLMKTIETCKDKLGIINVEDVEENMDVTDDDSVTSQEETEKHGDAEMSGDSQSSSESQPDVTSSTEIHSEGKVVSDSETSSKSSAENKSGTSERKANVETDDHKVEGVSVSKEKNVKALDITRGNQESSKSLEVPSSTGKSSDSGVPSSKASVSISSSSSVFVPVEKKLIEDIVHGSTTAGMGKNSPRCNAEVSSPVFTTHKTTSALADAETASRTINLDANTVKQCSVASTSSPLEYNKLVSILKVPKTGSEIKIVKASQSYVPHKGKSVSPPSSVQPGAQVTRAEGTCKVSKADAVSCVLTSTASANVTTTTKSVTGTETSSAVQKVKPPTVVDDEPSLQQMEVDSEVNNDDTLIIDLEEEEEEDSDQNESKASSSLLPPPQKSNVGGCRKMSPPAILKTYRSKGNILVTKMSETSKPKTTIVSEIAEQRSLLKTACTSRSSTPESASTSSSSSDSCEMKISDVRSLSGTKHDWKEDSSMQPPAAQSAQRVQPQLNTQSQSTYPEVPQVHNIQSFRMPLTPPVEQTKSASPSTSISRSGSGTAGSTHGSSTAHGSTDRSREDTGQALTPAAVSLVNKYNQQIVGNMQLQLAELCKELLASTMNEVQKEADQRLQEIKERQQWTHEQQMAEIQHNHKIVTAEMKACWEAELAKALSDLQKKMTKEKEDAVAETKKKQWCADCRREAMYYCCWNTSYCSYACQQHHWNTHQLECRQLLDAAPETASSSTVVAVRNPQGDTGTITTNAMDKDERIQVQKFNLNPQSGSIINIQGVPGGDIWQTRLPQNVRVVTAPQQISSTAQTLQQAPPVSQPLQVQYLHSLGPTPSATFRNTSQVQLLTQRPAINTVISSGAVMPGNTMVFPLLQTTQPASMPTPPTVVNRPLKYHHLFKNV